MVAWGNEVVELAMPAEQVALSLLTGEVKGVRLEVGMRSLSCSRWFAVQAAMVRMLDRQVSVMQAKSVWWARGTCSVVEDQGLEGNSSRVPMIDSVKAPRTTSSLAGLQHMLGASDSCA